MRFETMAKRLAEKTGTPLLEKVLLGEAEVTELPVECMIWKGGKTKSKKSDWKLEKIRNGRGEVHPHMVQRQPYATVKYQGRFRLVHRLIYQFLMKPDFEFRMQQTCSTPVCVNPLHWHMSPVEARPVSKSRIPEPDEDWTEEIVFEMLDAILGDVPPPSNWDEVINHIDMQGAPPEVVRKALLAMNKEHLI